MKLTTLITLIITLYVLSPSAYAWNTGIVLYGGSVIAKDNNSNRIEKQVSAFNYPACDLQLRLTINSMRFQGYNIVNINYCKQAWLKLPNIPDLRIDDLCLPPCGIYLDDTWKEVIYPENYVQIKNLFEEFNMNEYIEQNKLLNEKFNIREFNKRLDALLSN